MVLMTYPLFPARHLVNTVFQEKYLLFTPGGSPLPWPPTNMVLVAERPSAG